MSANLVSSLDHAFREGDVDIRRIAQYRILKKLGAGGMGDVYLAEDTRLHRYVALKLLPDGIKGGDNRIGRFQEEARAASALNHPNIVTIYDFGEEEGVHFIAVEHIDGETLRHRLAKPISTTEAIDIAIGIASALVAAHEAWIVHRDIKPENVMIRHDGWVKVVDFGIAKLSDAPEAKAEEQTEVLRYTEPGVVKGTVHYMSPEQLRGLDVDARTDLFSLGIILYEMLALISPFGGRNANEVIASILERDPPPLTTFLPEIDPELERIVAKLLRKERDERYQTAREVVTDLRNLRQEIEFSVRQQRTSGSRQAVAPAPRRPGRAVALSGVAVAFLALVVAGVVAFQRHAIASVAVLPFVNANGDPGAEYLSEGLTESIIHNLSQIPKLQVVARSSTFRYPPGSDPLKAGRDLRVEAVLTGRLQQQNEMLVIHADLVRVDDGTQIWGARYNRKVADILAIQEEISREITENLRLRLSGEERARVVKRYTADAEAYRLYLLGRHQWNKRTEAAAHNAVAYFKSAIERDPQYALAWGGLADTYAMFAIYGIMAPEQSYPAARAAALQALEIDPNLAEAYASLGHMKFNYEWNWSEAERAYQRAIELNPNYATAHHWYALYLSAMRRHDAAIAEMKRALQLDPLSIIIRTGVGTMYYQAGRYDEAIAEFRATLNLEPGFPRTRFELARALEVSGHLDEALAEFSELDGGEPSVKAAIARVHALRGAEAEARALLADLAAVADERYVNPYDIAAVHEALGDRESAIAWLEKAYESRVLRLAYLQAEPMFRAMHTDPRFIELMRKVGLRGERRGDHPDRAKE